MRVPLEKEFFSTKEKIFAEHEGLKAYTFQYDTGIHAVKLENELGYIIVLPFKGQMIWDAVFYGRSLTMRTTFREPKNTTSFVYSYGCFLMHCGALRMGCPGPEDTHPLHGELPYADYDSAELIAGKDEKGSYVGLTGIYEYNKAFADNYLAQPQVKVYSKSSLIDISILIKNMSNYPMELMYMAHVNFRPVEYGRIVQSIDWSEENMEMRMSFPKGLKASEEFKNFLEKLKTNPRATEVIRPNDVYDPEVVFFLHSPRVDHEGWTHFMQVHTDNSADYIRYKPEELDHCSRWIVKTKNQEALGLALPSTCDAEGYIAEKRKGNIKTISPKGSFFTSLAAGCLNKEEALKMEDHIKQLMSGA